MLSGSRISHRHHRNLGFGFELGFGCFCYAKKFQLQISSSLNLKPKSTAINAPVEQGKRFSTSIQLKPSRSHAILLSHCFSQEKEHHKPPSEALSPVQGGIVALGKFDALHIGHRELAIQAAKVGVPFLLSFVGMAEVLGWEPRPPIVAKCDRKRILSSWAPYCGNMTPMEFEVEFSKVRYLTPRQFVEKLSKELGVRGVVAGENYRFGYRASGNTFDLKNLCEDYNLESYMITSVMDKNRTSSDIIDSEDHGQVSSTRVRKALAKGNMNYVADLLGRRHRVMLMLEEEERKKSMVINSNRIISISRGCLLNLPPCEGRYENCSIVIGDGDEIVLPCRVLIDGRHVHMEFDEELVEGHISISSQRIHLLGIEFGRS